ncbi:MAG: molybdopterin molybdotransferase MoeA [Rhodospirillales bacterium]|nr:molybdopterin molybdotransferase MoeA [Rhodospirillales bacterium]
MSQAKDCCFSGEEKMMPLDDAIAKLKTTVSPVVAEEAVPLRDCLGRVLAQDVIAPMSVPPHNNSAVDGYAVQHQDLLSDGPTTLPVTERIAAGHPLGRAAEQGEALRIFTGAPVPEGSDTIVMQEDTAIDGENVVINPGIKLGANLRHAGEDITMGDVILKKGTKLRPQEIGLAASVGCQSLMTLKKLRVAVFSTGDEVKNPGQELVPGGIYDSNRFIIMSQLEGMGCDITDLGILPDRLDLIQGALEKAAPDHDLMITSGGVSLGEEDHVKAAVEALGALHFWKLAIKPGRPIALGQVGQTPFIGLPGNPVAALVTFMRIGRPVVMLLSGRDDINPVLYQVKSAFDFDKKPGRREWLRAKLIKGDGELSVDKFKADGSGILNSMVQSDGLIELGEDCTEVKKGSLVNFLPFSEVAR